MNRSAKLATVVLLAFVLVMLAWQAAHFALVVLTVGTGILGLICLKLKYPIVGPHAPLFAVVAYSFLWAEAITLALFLGPATIGTRNSFPQMLALKAEAIPFFFDAAVALFVASKVSSSRLAQRNALLASALVYFIASTIFSLLPPLATAASLAEYVEGAVRSVQETLYFPIRIWDFALGLLDGGSRVMSRHLGYVRDNMFTLSHLFAKLFAIAAIVQAMRGLLKKQHLETDTAQTVSSPPSMADWQGGKLFLAAFVLGIGTAISSYVSFVPDRPDTNPLLSVLFMVTYFAFWGTLFASRRTLSTEAEPEAVRGPEASSAG